MPRPTQKDLILDEEWDSLIVLDACRYDFFEAFYDIYPNFSEASLDKVESIGTATPEMACKTFTGDYDWEVVSANPWLNGSGHSMDALGRDDVDDYYFGEHFNNVYDIWKKGSAGVRPEKVAEFIFKNIDRFNDNKSMFWFLQPHSPYKSEVRFNIMHGVKEYFPPEIYEEFGPEVSEDMMFFIRESYKFNLLDALFHVSRVAGKLEGRVAVTSDHGERLLDSGGYYIKEDYKDVDNVIDAIDMNHIEESDDAALKDVPWCILPDDRHDIVDMGDEDLVRIAYQTVLGRDPDSEGLDNYTGLLDEGWSRKRLFKALLHSDEYRDKIGDPHSLSIPD